MNCYACGGNYEDSFEEIESSNMKHFNHQRNVEIIKSLQAKVTELEQAQPKWISVEDELPRINVDVLIYPVKMHLGDEPVYTGHRRKDGKFEYIWCGSIYTISDVTHWMPLPQQPEVK